MIIYDIYNYNLAGYNIHLRLTILKHNISYQFVIFIENNYHLKIC